MSAPKKSAKVPNAGKGVTIPAAQLAQVTKLPPEARRLKGMDEADQEFSNMFDCLKRIRPNLRAEYLRLFLTYAHRMGGIKAK